MPKSYKKERDKLISEGVPEQEAKKQAAIHYNMTHKRKMGGHRKGEAIHEAIRSNKRTGKAVRLSNLREP